MSGISDRMPTAFQGRELPPPCEVFASVVDASPPNVCPAGLPRLRKVLTGCWLSRHLLESLSRSSCRNTHRILRGLVVSVRLVFLLRD